MSSKASVPNGVQAQSSSESDRSSPAAHKDESNDSDKSSPPAQPRAPEQEQLKKQQGASEKKKRKKRKKKKGNNNNQAIIEGDKPAPSKQEAQDAVQRSAEKMTSLKDKGGGDYRKGQSPGTSPEPEDEKSNPGEEDSTNDEKKLGDSNRENGCQVNKSCENRISADNNCERSCSSDTNCENGIEMSIDVNENCQNDVNRNPDDGNRSSNVATHHVNGTSDKARELDQCTDTSSEACVDTEGDKKNRVMQEDIGFVKSLDDKRDEITSLSDSLKAVDTCYAVEGQELKALPLNHTPDTPSYDIDLTTDNPYNQNTQSPADLKNFKTSDAPEVKISETDLKDPASTNSPKYTTDDVDQVDLSARGRKETDQCCVTVESSPSELQETISANTNAALADNNIGDNGPKSGAANVDSAKEITGEAAASVDITNIKIGDVGNHVNNDATKDEDGESADDPPKDKIEPVTNVQHIKASAQETLDTITPPTSDDVTSVEPQPVSHQQLREHQDGMVESQLMNQIKEQQTVIARLQAYSQEQKAESNLLTTSLRTKLRRRDNEIKLLKAQYEQRMTSVLSRLLFLEGHLQKEHKAMTELLQDKDDTIRRQKAHITDLKEKEENLLRALKESHVLAENNGLVKQENAVQNGTISIQDHGNKVILRAQKAKNGDKTPSKVRFSAMKERLRRHKSSLELYHCDRLETLEEGGLRYGSQENLVGANGRMKDLDRKERCRSLVEYPYGLRDVDEHNNESPDSCFGDSSEISHNDSISSSTSSLVNMSERSGKSPQKPMASYGFNELSKSRSVPHALPTVAENDSGVGGVSSLKERPLSLPSVELLAKDVPPVSASISTTSLSGSKSSLPPPSPTNSSPHSESNPFKSLKNVFKRRGSKKKKSTTGLTENQESNSETLKQHFKKYNMS